MPEVSKRMQFFTDSPIARMSILSDKYGAINLSAGFPEFSPPAPILNSLKDIVDRGPHQYSLDAGAESFRQALADYRFTFTGQWLGRCLPARCRSIPIIRSRSCSSMFMRMSHP